ncbi:MAG: urease accessory protein UreE [Prochlorococcaceae cyanobacterium]
MAEPLVLRQRHPANTTVARATAEPAAALRLSLSAEERTRLRGLRHSGCGRPLLLQLPRGEPLQPGEWLLADDPAAPPVRVEAAEEALLEVRAEGVLELLQAAYHLGNRHVALHLEPGRLLLLDDPVLAALLRHRGLRVTPCRGPFLPEGGAYAHAHPHDHGHSDPTTGP